MKTIEAKVMLTGIIAMIAKITAGTIRSIAGAIRNTATMSIMNSLAAD